MKKRFLFLLLPILFISKVNAEVADFDVLWRNSIPSDVIGYSDMTVWNVTNTINQRDNFKPYLIFYTCETGYVNISNVSNVKGKINFVSKGNTQNKCTVDGYSGHLEYYIFFISDYDTASGAYMTNTWTMNVQSTVNYNNFQQILAITTTDSAGTTSDYYSILNDLYYELDALKSNTNATQSSINNLQSSINALESSVLAGQEEIKANQQETNQKLEDIDGTLKDDNTQQAQDSAGGFFNDFTTDTHGLTAIITAPLSLISKITSASCSPLVIPLPYVDKDLTLPCMGAIYSQYFGSFLSIYQIITFGIIAYWVCVRIFNLVKDFKNPDHDEIEVLDL